MNNLEWLLKNYKKYEVKLCFPVCELCFFIKNKKECDNCGHCEFYDDEKAFEYLLQEHKEPIKLKQWEYDFLNIIIDEGHIGNWWKFNELICYSLKNKGYFKGVTDTSIKIEDILKNYEIVSDDYEGFEDCK